MQRRLLINDRPRLPRPRFGPAPASGDVVARLLACLALSIATVLFFLAYDAVAHRGTSMTAIGGHAQPVMAKVAAPSPDSIAPDMNSPAVAFANADVSQAAAPAARPGPEKRKTAVAAPRKKTPPRMVQRTPRSDPMQAYGWTSRPYESQFGGFRRTAWYR